MMINIQFAGDFSSVESVYATMVALKILAVPGQNSLKAAMSMQRAYRKKL